MNKRTARVIELLISPLWLILLIPVWRSDLSLRAVALISAAVAVYYLFFVPRTCGALLSDDERFCTRGGRGFLLGCGELSHLRWNLRKYFPGGRTPRRRVNAGARSGGSSRADNPADENTRTGRFRLSEVLAGSEALVAILSLIVSILSWQFPQT